MLTTTEQVLERAKALARRRKPLVAVAGAEDPDVLTAVRDAHAAGMVGAVLVGKADRVRAKLAELDFDPGDFEIADADGIKATVTRAVDVCSSGHAHILMKGKVPTPDLMKAMLSPKAGLRQGRLLSHCAVLEVSGYPKLISVTDGGVVAQPDFLQKLAILENALRVSQTIGVKEPKVAILGVMDEPDPDFPSTLEAAALARLGFVRGLTRHIEGPLTMGSAMAGSLEGAWESSVMRDPDILICHSIEEANISVKALVNLRGATFMGVITGARVPLSLVSRADPPRNKLAALALAAVMAGEEVA